MLVGGAAVRVYDLRAGERIATHAAGGPWVDLSPSGRWLATTDGSVRDAVSGELMWRAPYSGMPRFVDDERVLMLSRGRATLWGWRGGIALADIDDDRLDPTASARVVFGPEGLVAVADPAGDRLALFSLDEVRAVPLDGDGQPAVDAAFSSSGLWAVQSGALQHHHLPSGDCTERRQQGKQHLSVAAASGAVAWTTIGMDDTYLLHYGDGAGEGYALPGRAPPCPSLRHTAAGWLVELWAGVALHRGGRLLHQLRLPVGRDGARPLLSGRSALAAGGRLLLACQPPLAPYVYRLDDLSFEARLEAEPPRAP